MRSLPALFIFLFTSLLAQAQQADSLNAQIKGYDSLLQGNKQKLASVQSNLSHQSDSVKNIYKGKLSRIDSINTSFHSKTDSVQQSLHGKLADLNSSGGAMQHKVDSLKALNLPTEKYTHKLDSINQARENTIAKANEKIQSLKSQTTDKLKAIQLPPELQSKVSDVTKNIDGFKLPGDNLNMPSLNIPDNSLGKVGDVDLSSVSKMPDVGKLPEVGGELKDLQGSMKDVTKVTGEIGGYQKDVQAVTSGNLNEVKELPKALETKAADLSGVSGIQNETKVLDQYKDQLGTVQNPDAMKQEVVQQVQQQAINHFAGKEQVLQQAMDKMAKYKKKYSSLQSLSEIGKKRHNDMHGKPLVERLLPALGLQIFTKRYLMIDFSPYLGYRLTPRLTSGVGFNYRFAYDNKHQSFHKREMVYGPRVFSEFNLFKGFFPRIELEAMNTPIQTTFSPTKYDPRHREWIYSAFGGLKKTYRFFGHVNGTSSVMVNLYNPRRKSPYSDLVNVRIGFEFPMKKKVKKTAN